MFFTLVCDITKLPGYKVIAKPKTLPAACKAASKVGKDAVVSRAEQRYYVLGPGQVVKG